MGSGIVSAASHETFDYLRYVNLQKKLGRLRQNALELLKTKPKEAVEREIREQAIVTEARNGKAEKAGIRLFADNHDIETFFQSISEEEAKEVLSHLDITPEEFA